MTVKDIVEKWLKDNGYDGLACSFCGCKVGDLMPCGEPQAECMAGFLASKYRKVCLKEGWTEEEIASGVVVAAVADKKIGGGEG